MASAVVLAAAALVSCGCGGGGGGGDSATAPAPAAVARVDGRPITRAQLAHWTAIKRAEARLTANGSTVGADDLQRQALAFLITGYWLEGEAAAQNVKAPPAEVQATLNRLRTGTGGASFSASLRRRGLSNADELFALRLGALAGKLRAKLGAGSAGSSGAVVQRRIAAFIAAYQQRWKQRTTCEPGYVIAQCSEGEALPGG